jgi:hypothetical protein
MMHSSDFSKSKKSIAIILPTLLLVLSVVVTGLSLTVVL